MTIGMVSKHHFGFPTNKFCLMSVYFTCTISLAAYFPFEHSLFSSASSMFIAEKISEYNFRKKRITLDNVN